MARVGTASSAHNVFARECGNCKHWAQHQKAPTFGKCRLYAPRFTWTTSENDVCSEFRREPDLGDIPKPLFTCTERMLPTEVTPAAAELLVDDALLEWCRTEAENAAAELRSGGGSDDAEMLTLLAASYRRHRAIKGDQSTLDDLHNIARFLEEWAERMRLDRIPMPLTEYARHMDSMARAVRKVMQHRSTRQ